MPFGRQVAIKSISAAGTEPDDLERMARVAYRNAVSESRAVGDPVFRRVTETARAAN